MEMATKGAKEMWHYGMYGNEWGTVEASTKQEARNLARAKHNLRTTKGMWFNEGSRPVGKRPA